MNEKTPNTKENNQESKKGTIGTVGLVIPILVALLGSPKEMEGKNRFESEGCRIELATNLGNDRIFTNDNQERIRSKEEMTIDYIGRNLYINGKSANELNANIKKISENIYSVEFEHEFLEGTKKIDMRFETAYENNSISMNFQNYKIFTDNRHTFPVNTYYEIDRTTHNKYDVRTIGNGKRENFNIVYNDYKTKEAIKNIIKNQTIESKTKFERIDELENTQLTGLNNPYLGKEVFKDEDGYYRTLFYSTNGKKIDITNIYFTTNGEFNAEKTAEKKEKLTILGIEINYEINSNGEFIISESSKQALIEKVKHDRKILIQATKNIPIADSEVFSALNRDETAEDFGPSSKIISLNPILGIYAIKLNNDSDKNLDQLYCKVEGENLVLVDETGKTANNIYFNYETGNKKETNYYRINKGNNGPIITKISTKLENPKDNLPDYTGDTYAINLLTKSGNLTNFEGGYLNYFNNEGILIGKIPCDKQEDGSYKFNEEKYHTKIEALNLFKYHGFENKVQRIDELAASLGITDADIRDIFEKSLKNDGLDFTQNIIEITNPSTGESIYYKLDKDFQIQLDKNLYKIAEKHIDFIQNRLELAQIINNSKVLWKNGKEYKDFEQFIGGEAGIGKQIISPEQLKKFISGESDEITVRISRGSGNHTEIIYTASGKTLKSRLKSGEGKGSVYLNPQQYYISVDKHGNIILDPKEERR